MGQQGGAEDVGEDHGRPQCRVAGPDGVTGHESGVGHRRVKGTEVLHGASYGRLGGLPVRRVPDKTQQPVGVAGLVEESLQFALVAAGARHTVATLEEQPRGVGADTAGRAGGQYGLAGHGHAPGVWMMDRRAAARDEEGPFESANPRKSAPSEAGKVAFMGGINATFLSAGPWVPWTNGTSVRRPHR